MVNIIKISIVILVTALLVFLSACEKQPETKKQATIPVIVSGTISHSPSGKTEKKPVSEGSTDPVKINKSPIQPKIISKAKTVDGKTTQPSSGAVKEDLLKKEQEVAGSKLKNPDTAKAVVRYDSKGKLNPFIPLLQQKEMASVTTPFDDGKPKRMLTPLEKLELSQIKLVAVILMKNRQLAMVEETTGKGYEVRIGTYMGKNNGQVSKINQSSIIVKEYVKDYKGKRQARFEEIKLHKKEGGE